MKPLVVSQHVRAPQDRVFTEASQNYGKHIEGLQLEVLTQPPWGVGTRLRETRKMFGREHSEIFEVVAWDPPRSYALGCNSCGTEMRTELVFVPESGGTRIGLTMTCRPLSFGAKLFAPLSPLMSGPLKKAMRKDLAQLAASIESGGG